MTKHLYTLRAS